MDPRVIFFMLLVFLNILIARSCKNHKTCHDCITDSSFCVWCASTDPNFDNMPRCRSQGSYDDKWCAGSLDIPEIAKITANEKHNRNFSSTTGNVIQIKPQLYNVKLRVGQPINFNFSFQGAKDYPVDLYILLDASNTMSDFRNSIANHSETIYNTMQNMTKKVNMGFGTFIDKNTQPFTRNVSANKAYSFRNNLNLTSDLKKFKTVVEQVKFGLNYDPLEGGFDALAQVIVCNLNWREKSRRIIVFFTDSSHHTIGDGRSAGIFKPYDGKCHTNEQGIYTKELEMDYPSVNTIDRLAANKVTIIFALTDSAQAFEPFYEDLKKYIRGSKLAIMSKNDIVTRLKESYKEISTYIKLDVDIQSGYGNNFQIQFDPDCTKNYIDDKCKVEPEQRRDFTGTITLTKYYGKDTESIDISIQGLNESLKLNIEVIKCDCERHEESSSEYCFGQKRQCGVCICDESRHGNRCMCTKNDSKETDDTALCLAPGESKLCSGNGECACGLCQCANDRLFGRFCECDRRRCPGTVGNVPCNGHGNCSCSEDETVKETCSCHEGWAHRPGDEISACSCRLATDSCMLNDTITLCNQRGKCVCDACECEPIKSWDKRTNQNELCQIEPCPDCHGLQCNVIRTCVLCYLEAGDCEKDCDGIVLDKKYDILPTDLNSSEWSVCSNQKVNVGCYTKFLYRYDDKVYRILLRMQEDINCADNYYNYSKIDSIPHVSEPIKADIIHKKNSLIITPSSVYGGILLITLLLVGIITILAWKCLTWYQDRKEYEKFEAQHRNELEEHCENPLYDGPTTTFRNPTFNRSFKG